MMTPHLIVLCLTLTALSAAPARGGDGDVVTKPLDSSAFIDRLIERYRAMASYRDLTNVVRITRTGNAPQDSVRSETRLSCEMLDGELRIVTPGAQLRRSLYEAVGFSMTSRDHVEAAPNESAEPEQSSSANASSGGKDLMQGYRLWLAPHMVLKFADEPLRDLRPKGAGDGFTATGASAVRVQDREMVHLELKSGGVSAAADAPDDYDAKVDLYVNPESMLIERIESHERLPDGGSIETTYMIEPLEADAPVITPPLHPVMVPEGAQPGGEGEKGAVEPAPGKANEPAKEHPDVEPSNDNGPPPQVL